MSLAYYSENDPFAAQWLRNLIAAGQIAPGVVDDRSITAIKPSDLAGYRQFHAFGGIGGWSYALRLAGIPDDADVWTGSCPCQPFSSAGKRVGTRDARHLWPAWFELIRECRPPTIFGEQVASRDGLAWLDIVRSDLERCGYAFGASDLCAAGVGAPHIRQRLYFVAHAAGRASRQRVHRPSTSDLNGQSTRSRGQRDASSGSDDFVANASEQRREGERLHIQSGESRSSSIEIGGGSEAHELADAVFAGRTEGRTRTRGGPAPRGCEHREEGGATRLGDASRDGAREHARELRRDEAQHEIGSTNGHHASVVASTTDRHGTIGEFWTDCDWLPCTDGVSRPVEPGTFPLAHGVPGRVGLLRGYGNAIVPQAAAIFIQAALDLT